MRKIWKKANSLLLAAAMAVTLLPAQTISAAGLNDTVGVSALQKAGARDSGAVIAMGKEYTVIQGNVPVFPEKVNITADDGTAVPTEVQWSEWDEDAAPGRHTVTGTAGEKQVSVTVNVLPCDEIVADATATGTDDSDASAIHSLKGYKGKFVAEYDIVPYASGTTDRAIIYLPEKTSGGQNFTAGNCWDAGARLQFKYEHNNVRYFQTQIGDGQVVDNAKYYPTNNEIAAAIEAGNKDIALVFDEVSTYRVRIEMDTLTDTTKGNYKIYITDPQGAVHEVTQPGGNGFRIYPKDGIIKNFAAVRGSYRMVNHKISWTSGYANKKTEIYLKEENAAEYVKHSDDIMEKELPGIITAQPETKIVRDNKSYILNAEESSWYDGNAKVDLVTADEGQTVTYRAYYNYEAAIDKTALNAKVEAVKDFQAEDYTSSSWKTFYQALQDAIKVNAATTESQTAVDKAKQALEQAESKLVSIKNLKVAYDRLKAELTEKEGQKDNYTNWDEVERAVKNAENVLKKANATKAQVENAEKDLEITLILKENPVKLADKTALNQAIAAAKAKNAADYETASYRNMQTKLATANAVAANVNATQAEVDNAKNDLLAAINGLVKAEKVTSIKPAAKTYKIAVNKKLDLKKVFKVLPANAANKKLTYAMDKKYNKYASLKSGVVTVKKKGVGKTIVVRASATDGSGKNATVKIKIMQHAVTKITVKKKSLTVKAGKKVKIECAVKANGNKANKAVEYTSSNEKLATVKKGVVTTKKGKKGKVTITIKSTDGTGKSVKVKIKIK